MVLYNTPMGVASGAALLLLVVFASQARRSDRRNQSFRPGAWAWAFLPLGLILVVTGTRMSLTWPLQPAPASASPHCCRADNILFGEPSLFFGAILLALGATLLWFARQEGDPGRQTVRPVETLRPLGYVGAVAGLTLFPIAFAGAYFGMFIAPPEEPFSSMFRVNNIGDVVRRLGVCPHQPWSRAGPAGAALAAAVVARLDPAGHRRAAVALAEPRLLLQPHRPRRLSHADTKPLRT
jgi:hypothetical protein